MVETPIIEKPVAEEKPVVKSVGKTTVSFKVQFFISDTKVSANDKRIANIKDVDYYEYNGSYRYTSGNFRTKEEAFARQKEVQKQGYPDAWVVCFINGERVSMREAEDALERNRRGE